MSSQRPQRKGLTRTIWGVFFACTLFWVLWLPLQIESRLPESTQHFLNEGSSSALVILFVGLPLLLPIQVVVAAVTTAILLRPFVPRSTAREVIVSVSRPRELGRVENFLLSLFKGDQS